MTRRTVTVFPRAPSVKGRGLRRVVTAALAIAPSCALPSCTGAIGAGAAMAVAGAAVLAHECYGYVVVEVRDAVTGFPVCDAEVEARGGADGDEEEAVTPCYHASLPPGRWAISASMPGRREASTVLTVAEPRECAQVVYTVTLTLQPLATVLEPPLPGFTPAPVLAPPPGRALPAAAPLPAAAVATEPSSEQEAHDGGAGPESGTSDAGVG